MKSKEQKLGSGARKIELERHLDANARIARREFGGGKASAPARKQKTSPAR